MQHKSMYYFYLSWMLYTIITKTATYWCLLICWKLKKQDNLWKKQLSGWQMTFSNLPESVRAVFLCQTYVSIVLTHTTIIFINNHHAHGYHSPNNHEGCILKGHLWDHGTYQNTKLSRDFVGSITLFHKYLGTHYFISVFCVHNVLEDIRHSEHSRNSPLGV